MSIPMRNTVPASTSQGWIEIWTVTLLGLLCGVSPLFSRMERFTESDWIVTTVSLWDIAINTSALFLVAFYIRRNNETWPKFGVKKPALVFDTAGGLLIVMILLALVMFTFDVILGFWSAEQIASFVRARPRYMRPVGTYEYALSSAAMMFSAVTEEIAMRGFVLIRTAEVCKSPLVAIPIASLLSLNYHVSYGLGAAITSLIICLVFATIFWFGQRIWPLVVAHVIIAALMILR